VGAFGGDHCGDRGLRRRRGLRRDGGSYGQQRDECNCSEHLGLTSESR
jgi:hypothetical protein